MLVFSIMIKTLTAYNAYNIFYPYKVVFNSMNEGLKTAAIISTHFTLHKCF